MLRRLFKKKEQRKQAPVAIESSESAQIARNKHDYEHVKKIGKPNLFVEENFLDENYERFVKYVQGFLKEFDATCLEEFFFDITPEELKLLEGKKVYEKVLLKEEENFKQYAVVATPLLNTIVKTRGIPNRTRVLKMMIDCPDVWQFNHVAYEDKYINAFECYVEKVAIFLKAPNSVDFEVFRFHPMLYNFICNNFDEVYRVVEESADARNPKAICKYLTLTKLGEDLIAHSNEISKKLGEERDYRYFCW